MDPWQTGYDLGRMGLLFWHKDVPGSREIALRSNRMLWMWESGFNSPVLDGPLCSFGSNPPKHKTSNSFKHSQVWYEH